MPNIAMPIDGDKEETGKQLASIIARLKKIPDLQPLLTSMVEQATQDQPQKQDPQDAAQIAALQEIFALQKQDSIQDFIKKERIEKKIAQALDWLQQKINIRRQRKWEKRQEALYVQGQLQVIQQYLEHLQALADLSDSGKLKQQYLAIIDRCAEIIVALTDKITDHNILLAAIADAGEDLSGVEKETVEVIAGIEAEISAANEFIAGIPAQANGNANNNPAIKQLQEQLQHLEQHKKEEQEILELIKGGGAFDIYLKRRQAEVTEQLKADEEKVKQAMQIMQGIAKAETAAAPDFFADQNSALDGLCDAPVAEGEVAAKYRAEAQAGPEERRQEQEDSHRTKIEIINDMRRALIEQRKKLTEKRNVISANIKQAMEVAISLAQQPTNQEALKIASTMAEELLQQKAKIDQELADGKVALENFKKLLSVSDKQLFAPGYANAHKGVVSAQPADLSLNTAHTTVPRP